MLYHRLSWFLLSMLLLLATPAIAQTPAPAGSYAPPAEFMNLFFDFTGSNEPDYPGGQPTLGEMLTQSVIAQDAANGAPGPLVMVVGSDIYVYDSTSGARLGQARFRVDRASGFYELTAISHIGPRSPIWPRSRPTATPAGSRALLCCKSMSRRCARSINVPSITGSIG